MAAHQDSAVVPFEVAGSILGVGGDSLGVGGGILGASWLQGGCGALS